MSSRVRITQRAIADIAQARDWYERQSPGAGARFIARVDDAIQRVADNPLIFQIAVRDVRRARLKTFPYGIFYRVETDETVVIACLHYRRNPKLVAVRAGPPRTP